MQSNLYNFYYKYDKFGNHTGNLAGKFQEIVIIIIISHRHLLWIFSGWVLFFLSPEPAMIQVQLAREY